MLTRHDERDAMEPPPCAERDKADDEEHGRQPDEKEDKRDLLEAIQAHRSPGNAKFGPSEANAVINNFSQLTELQKQDLLNFLRSL